MNDPFDVQIGQLPTLTRVTGFVGRMTSRPATNSLGLRRGRGRRWAAPRSLEGESSCGRRGRGTDQRIVDLGWACGALVALLLVAIGYGLRSLHEGASPLLGGTHLHAATASQNEAYAMATGAIDEEVEGVYLLNFLTGDLQCSVMGIRTGRFAGMFKTNVIRDLGMDPAKQPAYLMATGRVGFARGWGRPDRHCPSCTCWTPPRAGLPPIVCPGGAIWRTRAVSRRVP